jgi:Uri superfamily endonuclease
MTVDRRAQKGTYLLVARLKRAARIQVGKLGQFDFAAGWYAYAGSALGPGGLEARLARHARRDKRNHWHIDYLLQHAVLEEIWQAAWPQRLECAWAAAIAGLPGAQLPVRGFGASDCRCAAHLIYLPERLDDGRIAARLCNVSPTRAALRRTPPAC